MPKQGGGVLSSLGEVVWRGGANFKGLYMRLGGQKLHLTEKFGHVTRTLSVFVVSRLLCFSFPWRILSPYARPFLTFSRPLQPLRFSEWTLFQC
jgi:hypothetical protein